MITGEEIDGLRGGARNAAQMNYPRWGTSSQKLDNMGFIIFNILINMKIIYPYLNYCTNTTASFFFLNLSLRTENIYINLIVILVYAKPGFIY